MAVPETMRALRKPRPEPGAELADVPVPEPGPGEVLIEVAAASICGTDLHIHDWDPWAAGRVRTPVTFGHEVAGKVVATGPEVHHVAPGAFVSVEGHVYCGFCPQCRKGRAHICERLRILGVDFDGAFAQYVAVPERNVWLVDKRIPPDVASIHDPFGNAVHTAFVAGGAEEIPTSTVVVLGCGPIGLFAVGVCRAAGARQVIAVEPNEFRQGLAKQMGADVVVDPTKEDPVEAVRAATDGHGAEVVLEMSGVPRVIDQGTRMLAGAGRLALLGLPTEPVTLDLTDQVIFKEARIYGVTGRELFRTWEQTSTLLATGMVDPTPVITHRFELKDHEEAFRVMRSGRAGKIILTP
ncbi:MAG: L-threonine 3-dehydrogenase [Actinobacteria bacterium]|nr:L-threonine 3-dehydrogenase [Actinomycetota bacterium]